MSWVGLATLGPFLGGVSVALFCVGVRNRLQEGSWSRFRYPRAWFGEGSGRVLDVNIDVFFVFSAHIVQDSMRQHKIA